MISQIERFRELYEYEKDCNDKTLIMIESVPQTNRTDSRYHQALALAAHLAFCREFWLGVMHDGEDAQGEWFEKTADLSSLRQRFATIESRWTSYLANLDDSDLAREFELPFGEYQMDWYVEGQILQLLCHAPYHRGQVALLVDQLGGTTVDTDYLLYARPIGKISQANIRKEDQL